MRRQIHLAAALGLMSLAGGLFVSAPNADAGACAQQMGFVPGLATPAGATIPSDGGVLVWPTEAPWEPGASRSQQGAVELFRGRQPQDVERVNIAPGWWITRPTTTRSGTLRVRFANSSRSVRMSGQTGTPLAAPDRPTVQYNAPRRWQGPRGNRMTSPRTTLTLRTAPPADAIGVVVVARGTSSGFALPVMPEGATAPSRVFSYATSAGRCRAAPPGSVHESGAAVEVSFVDAVGRRSPAVPTTVR